MSSISLNLLTNSTLEAQNPRRDTSIPTVSAGLAISRLFNELGTIDQLLTDVTLAGQRTSTNIMNLIFSVSCVFCGCSVRA